jgi:hypothetical protein
MRMIVRLIKKLIVVLSLLLGIALLILWSRTRHSDLLISGASGGTYRELRLGNSQIAFMFVMTWPEDQHVRFGRAVAREPGMTVSNGTATIVFGKAGASGTSGTSGTRSAGGAGGSASGGTLVLTNAPPAASPPTLALLDGSSITLQPDAKGWWPPVKSTGSGMVGGKSRLSGLTSTGTVALTGNISGSTIVTTQPASAAPITISGGGGAGAGTLTLNTLSGSASPTTVPFTSGSTTLNFTTLYLFTAHAYERYALPVWAVALIVMLPVWWALLVAALRARRRRIRRRKGFCERCGYDLRGSPTGGNCPECGTATTAIPAPPSGDALLARLR